MTAPKNSYRYCLDPFLLVNFVTQQFTAKPKTSPLAADFCSGTGIIALKLAEAFPSLPITGVEIQKQLWKEALLAKNEAKEKTAKVEFLNNDLRQYKDFLEPNSLDLIVSNPPYRKLNAGKLSNNSVEMLANHEVTLTLVQLIEAVRYGLKPLGEFYMSYHPSRTDELFQTMNQAGIKPHLVRFIHDKPDADAAIVLVKGIYKGRHHLKVLSPLYVKHLSPYTYL